MSHLQNLIVGLIKYILFSVFISLLCMVGMVSWTTGQFPPSRKQLKTVQNNMKGLMELVQAHSRGETSAGFSHEALLGLQAGAGGLSTGRDSGGLPEHRLPERRPGNQGDSSFYKDPELQEVNELLKHRANQAALSRSLSSFGELPSGVAAEEETGLGAAQKAMQEMARSVGSVVGSTKSEEASAERVRRLEDLVERLHGQVRHLSHEVQQLKKKSQVR